MQEKTFDIQGLTIATTKTVEWREEFPTPYMRFVSREGRNILQQKWILRTWTEQKEDWRDIPMGVEE